MAGSKEPIVKRYKGNPILTKHDVPYPVETVHNAGVVKHKDKYVMLFRSHLSNGHSIGAVPEDDGTIKIYWGGADMVMCVGTALVSDLVTLCLTNPRKA